MITRQCRAIGRENTGVWPPSAWHWRMRVSNSKVGASLVSMAQNWLDLAELAERNADNRSLRHRAIEAAIGAELKIVYGLPHSLPPHFLALLAQLNTENHGEG